MDDKAHAYFLIVTMDDKRPNTWQSYTSWRRELWMIRYSSIITLKKLACAITHALHEQQKYRGVFASA